MTNVHEHNDGTMSIKVQQLRSRYVKYVQYNCTHVLCECHGYKRDRESSRVPVKMFQRLSIILLKIMQHERKLHMKQELGLYKKREGNQILEQETLALQ